MPVGSATTDSHAQTMTKKAVRSQIALLRDDWFLPVQTDALTRALTYVGEGLPWLDAARKALGETYASFGISGIQDLIGSTPVAIEAAEANG